MKIIEKSMFFGANPEVFNLAREMRLNPTEAEKEMWTILRKFRHKGYVFRRQHPIEYYIADFYCHNLRLVIEVDGKIHTKKENQDHDDRRSGELERFGLKVIRFSNEQVMQDPSWVTAMIDSIIKEQEKHLSSPSHPGRGGSRG